MMAGLAWRPCPGWRVGSGAGPGQAAPSASGVLSFAPQRNICRSGALRCPAAGGPWATASELRSQHRAPGQAGCPSAKLTLASPACPPSLLWLRKTPEPSGKATGTSPGGGHGPAGPWEGSYAALKNGAGCGHSLTPVERRENGPLGGWLREDSTAFLPCGSWARLSFPDLHNYLELQEEG